MATNIIWHESNVTVIEYNCDSYLNTWIPIKWIAHDNYLHEQARIIDVQLMLNFGSPIITNNQKNFRLFRSISCVFLKRFPKLM